MLKVTPNEKQSDEALMREFSRHIRKSGLMQETRGRRYRDDNKSRNERRRGAQRRNIARAEREYQMKIGRIRPSF